MTTNHNIIEGKWTELKGEVQKAWGKLTSDDLEKTKGDFKSITGLLQQKYGETQDSYSKKLSDIYKPFQAQKDKAVEGTKEALKS